MVSSFIFLKQSFWIGLNRLSKREIITLHSFCTSNCAKRKISIMQKGTLTLTFLDKKMDNGDKYYLVRRTAYMVSGREVQTMYVSME